MAPEGLACAAWPVGWSDVRLHVPAICPAVSESEPEAEEGDVGDDDDPEQPTATSPRRVSVVNEKRIMCI